VQQTGVDAVQYLALEFALNKTLLDYLMAKPQTGDQWSRYWFKQILKGLKHINQKDHAHLDIKCENILLDHELNVKIGDFGFASLKAGVARNCGSEFHRAPEICRHQFPYDGEKADVFALGIVLYATQMRSFPVEKVFNVVDSNRYQLLCQGLYD
jgi:serine/threonine protein kinase